MCEPCTFVSDPPYFLKLVTGKCVSKVIMDSMNYISNNA